MADFLPNLQPKDVGPIVALILCFLAGMTVWITLQWRLHRRTEMEVALKHEMLNRGLSADEIERVMRASMTPAEPREQEKTAARPPEPERTRHRPWWAFLDWLEGQNHPPEPERPRRRRWWCHKG
jgi:hypothetical protein